MTDQEIIKALRCCASIASCYKCPFQTEMICRAMLKSAAADRLEELTESQQRDDAEGGGVMDAVKFVDAYICYAAAWLR